MKTHLLVALACFATLPVFAPNANATAVYSTSASSDFSLTIPTFSGGASVTGSVVIGSNTGTAAMGGTGVAMHATDSITPDGLHASYVRAITIGGSADAPPYSFASSSRMTGHLFTITNHRTETVEAPFAFFMAWTLLVGADDPALVSASTGAFFSIAGIDTEDLVIAGVGTISSGAYEKEIGISTDSPPPGVVDDFFIMGHLVLPPGVHMFSVITDAAGRASSNVVSEPGSGILVVLALALALGRSRRRV